jgi:heavy metal sensor kinase
MTSLSIKWRISLWISAVLLAVIATICIGAYKEFEESHLKNINRTLDAMANGIIASLDIRSDKEKWTAEVDKVTGRNTSKPPALYRIWLDGSSEDLLASDSPNSQYSQWLHNLPQQNKPQVENHSFFNIGLPENEYRANWLRLKVNGDTINIAVAAYSHYTYHEMSEFLTLLLVLGASLIIASVIATVWTVRCELLPIDKTAEQLKKITTPNIAGLKFDDKKIPKELHPFVNALNDLLSRLDAVLSRQKQFTSDAAHELRTPLSLAKSTLQTAQIQPRQPDEYRLAIKDSLESLARMEHLIEQLLLLARLDESGRITRLQEIRLDVLLRELAETYDKKMSPTGGKVIFKDSPEINIPGDLDELIRLFSNILDNACKYGPADGTIEISIVYEPPDNVTISIHDQGGNIPPDALPHLFDRFYRAELSRSKNTGGAGLGLAIARQIARNHNGDILITSNPSDGTFVRIRLIYQNQSE